MERLKMSDINEHPEQFKDFQQEFDNLWFGNLEEYFNHDAADYANIRNITLHFVNWQKEQFEKNRLSACDNMTKEEFDREQEFTANFIEKNNRMPTYSDAIEYGRKQMIEKACEWLNNFYSEDRHCFLVKEDIDAFIKAMEE